MKRLAFLIYAVFGYLIGLATIGYLMGFLADFGVPITINSGDPAFAWSSVPINLGLLALFGAHHSLTARASFKRWWARWVPEPIERATYLYMTAAVTALLVLCWQPVPAMIWQVENTILAGAIRTAYVLVWLLMFASTFHFGHLGFFGLHQAWNNLKRRAPAEVPFSTRYLYALVRHPISAGWMLVPWLTPHMSVGQLVWAVVMTAYVLIATKFEEADLSRALGVQYRHYQAEVPAFLPGVKRRAARVPPDARSA